MNDELNLIGKNENQTYGHITKYFAVGVCEKVGDEKVFIAKGIVATFHSAFLKTPT
jgi:hypothetical protein